MKTCTKCGIEKELTEFYKNKKRKDGLRSECKNCSKEYQGTYDKENKKQRKENYENDKIKLLEKRKIYYELNKEKINQRQRGYNFCIENKERRKEYLIKNKKKINEKHKKYMKEKYKNDPQFKMAHNLRTRANKGIVSQGGIKSASTEELLGCSFKEASLHIENQFLPGMTWENHGEWEIDHIRPMISFDLTKPEEQKLCCHYTNLQPLWAKDNYIKGGKWLNDNTNK